MTNGWDKSAQAWLAAMADGGDWARSAMLDPIMLDRARQLAPAQALDVGCGEGRFCRLLAEAGVRTTGIDPTAALIEAARRRHGGGRYLLGAAEDLPFADDSFDLVVSYLSLVDIENLHAATAEMTRVLAPGGVLLVANLASHNTAGEWLKDGAGQPLGYLIDGYLEERPLRQQWDGIDILNFHRPLSRYMDEFLSCGLRLTFFDESTPTTAEDPTNGKFERAPCFVVMEWRKAKRSMAT